MDVNTWLVYSVAVFLLCLTPGPNSFVAITNGARFGLAGSIYSTIGCLTGISILLAIAISGLGIILFASQKVFLAIKWLGVMYLAYLGIKLIFSQSPITAQTQQQAKTPAIINKHKLFHKGY